MYVTTTLEGEPKEIAALVLELQRRQETAEVKIDLDPDRLKEIYKATRDKPEDSES